MDFEQLYEIIFRIYTDCNVTEFPIDCFEVVRRCGYRIKRYSELTPKKKEACMRLSPDACIVKDTLYYQDQNIPERTRFSVMHELGHVFLQTPVEETADTFSSHILAPRIMIHKNGCQNAEQIHETFGLSYTASNRALNQPPFPQNAAGRRAETGVHVPPAARRTGVPSIPAQTGEKASDQTPARDGRAGGIFPGTEVDLWGGLCVPHAGRAVVMRKCTVIKPVVVLRRIPPSNLSIN